jgi:putative porin
MNKFVSAAVGAALLSVACVPAVQAQSADLQALKAQLEALQKKVSELEAQQKQQQEVADKTLDQVAQQKANVGDWVGRFTWKGDIRYRNEDIKQEGTAERDRDRIRVRAGLVAKVNDTVTAEVQLTTGESLASGGYGDARSSNQSLTDASSRKRVWFDTAFFTWKPNANWSATLGKQRYPWVRPTNGLFFDNDINPEGVAINWQQGSDGLFASAWWMQLTERGGGADSTLAGGQFGWRGPVGPARLTVAAGYFDHGAVEGYNATQDAVPGNAFGNTTTGSTAICRPGVLSATVTSCIANDFNIYEALAELTFTVGGRPLAFIGDYAKNNKADLGATPGLDTAFGAGVQYGRVSTLNTWEIGYLYQKIENDALYGQWVDSDFGGGLTGTKGHVFRIGYGLGRNFRFNTTYFVNDQNIDIPVSVNGRSITDRKYKRLQLDVVASF